MTARSASKTRPVGQLIRNARRSQNCTLQELSARADLSVGYLSQIERDIATPSLSSLARLATALSLDLSYLMPMKNARGLSTRAVERETTWVREGGMTYQSLHGEFVGATFSAYLITLPAGFVSEIHNHTGEEFLEVRKGRVHFEIDGRLYDLGPGDTLHYRSDMQHQARNPHDTEALILWVGDSPSLRQRPRVGRETGE